MKKHLFNLKSLVLTLAVGLLSFSNIAQMQIGNSDFELFDEIGDSKERPVNWNNIKNGDLCFLCGFGSIQTNWRDTDIRPGSAGTYSVKIKSGSAGGFIVNGATTLGRLHAPNTTPTNGYNKTTRSNPQYSEVMTDKPDSIVFWAKYSVTSSADSARISAFIHGNHDFRDPQDNPSSSQIVAKSSKNFQTNGVWKRISVPVDYSGPSTDAQYILITLTSSYVPGSGVDGATLFVDDLELIYNPNTLDISPIADQNIFTNAPGTLLTANETANASSSITSRKWKFATSPGGAYTDIAGQTGVTYTPLFATAGTYYVVCETNFDGDIKTSNEVKVVVSNYSIAIAPTAVQNLIENQLGTTLTVTENTTAISRQWKSATTSGGTYTNISGETGATYTPVFATAGTYFVICESTFAGGAITSNEVKVVVVEFTIAIAPVAVQNLVENQSGTTLTVTESVTGASRQWKSAATSGGTYTDITGQTATSYTPQFATAGTYFVVCESTLFGNVVVSNEVEIIVVVPTVNVVSISPTSIQTLIENQAGTVLTVSEIPGAANSREWQYTTTSGAGYTSFSTTETATTYTPVFANEGTYYVVCISDFGGGDIVTSSEVQINVVEFSNAIDPVTDQSLFVNDQGSVLTVTETPTADSREWKVSVVSGSGYTSFSTVETGMTYTPEFATEGTYYIVCESTIGSTTTLSNEVIIVVDPLLGLSENAIPSFAVFAIDQKLNIDFSNVDMDNASIRVLSIENKLITEQALESNQMNSIQLSVPTGVYFFSISNGKQFFQGKVFIK